MAPLLSLLGPPHILSADALRARARRILPNIVRKITAPLGGAVGSFLILRVGSRALLNRYAAVVLVQGLALQLASWGSRTYLYKAFAADPAGVRRILGETFTSKAVLLLPATLLLLLVPRGPGWAWVLPVVWAGLVARIALQTLEPLVTLRRAFPFAAAVDLGALSVFAAVFAGSALVHDGAQPTLLAVFGATSCADGFRACAYLVRFRRDRPDLASLRRGLGFLAGTFPFFLITLASAFAQRIDLYCLGFFARRDELGQYNVLVSLIGGGNAIIAAIPDTFNVTLLRAPGRVFTRVWRNIYTVGVTLTAAGVLAIGIVMRHLYGLPLSTAQLLLIFTVGVEQLLTMKAFSVITRETSQLLTTIAVTTGGIVNLIVGLAIIQRQGVTGALLASNAGQAAIVIVALLLICRHHARLRHHHHP